MTEGPKRSEPEADLPGLYAGVVLAYARNSIRATQARLTQARLELAVPTAAISLPDVPDRTIGTLPEELQKGLGQMRKITPEEYRDWTYVANVSFLVYHTTLFDTFLQDTIEFLLCLHPGVMSDYSVPFSDVMNATARHEVLNAALRDKVRQIGFMSFQERLQWLRKRFGLKFAIREETLKELVIFSEARNSAVHDQGWFEFCFSENGTITASQTACPLHPSDVEWEDASRAKESFAIAASCVVMTVFTQVLNCEAPESLMGMLEVLQGAEA